MARYPTLPYGFTITGVVPQNPVEQHVSTQLLCTMPLSLSHLSHTIKGNVVKVEMSQRRPPRSFRVKRNMWVKRNKHVHSQSFHHVTCRAATFHVFSCVSLPKFNNTAVSSCLKVNYCNTHTHRPTLLLLRQLPLLSGLHLHLLLLLLWKTHQNLILPQFHWVSVVHKGEVYIFTPKRSRGYSRCQKHGQRHYQQVSVVREQITMLININKQYQFLLYY